MRERGTGQRPRPFFDPVHEDRRKIAMLETFLNLDGAFLLRLQDLRIPILNTFFPSIPSWETSDWCGSSYPLPCCSTPRPGRRASGP